MDHYVPDPDVVEAQRLIADIREKHTSVVHEELENIVNELLHLTSSELYDVSTHCIMELLQNADDNHYTDTPEPTLAFTYECRHLRVDCNEDGFKAKHVRAISTVRRSTKSRKNHSFDYTGEKGIGFKSVFRIADRVWISSCEFQFMFDKNQKFGIIAPEWSPFPQPRLPGQTSFWLRLSDTYDENELIEELQDFDSVVLLFLRRLTKVTLRVLHNEIEWTKTIVKTTTEEKGELVTVIGQCETTTTGEDESRVLMAHKEGQGCHIVFNHEIGNLPKEARREGCHTSILSVAFPVTGLPGRPCYGTQQIFALLPICDHGLKFMLNGDFVLSASRLNIDASLPWNQTLRDGLAGAFIEAVRTFIASDGKMRFIWPFFVPDSNTSSFFRPARDAILRELAESPVLESAGLQMLKPSELVYVDPAKYGFSDGETGRQPFTLMSSSAAKYLSPRYPDWAIDPIIDLGVLKLTDKAFLEDLQAMAAADPKGFQDRGAGWHQELARALLPMSRIDGLRALLKRLPIVPLSDGTWVPANRNPVFSSADLKLSKLPSSISLSVVDSDAAGDSSRRLLFQSLGISEISSPSLCRFIVDAHASPSFRPEKLSRVELISHAAYLFQASWQPPEDVKVDLWFATTNGLRCPGSIVYIRGDYEPESAAARVFDQLRRKFPTIRDNYFLGPVSSDATKLADKADCPFVTYQTLDSRGSELTFDLDDDVFSGCLDNRTDGPFILVENSNIATGNAVTTTIPGSEPRSLYLDIPPAPDIWDSEILHRDYFKAPGATGLDNVLPVGRWASYSRGLNLFDMASRGTSKADSMKSDKFKAWRTYMIKTLHLSEIPRLAYFLDDDCRQKYQLSEEFKFLFRVCHPSDVLHLLNEHWANYAEWIEIGATSKKDRNAVESNKRLLEELGDCQVQTRHGIHPLRDTVLPGLDPQMDSLDIPTPILDMPGSGDKTLRRRLSFFGIKVENDLLYYLACLQSLCRQQHCPEHDAISYIYEQIQVRYSSNEDEISEIFEANTCVYLGTWAPNAPGSGPWATVSYCTQNRIKVSELYPGCRTLFHGLLGGGGREVGSYVGAAANIDHSWSLPDISKLLVKVSSGLKDVPRTSARIWVRPLKKLAIFPTRRTREAKPYDTLVSTEDSTWFIADQPCFDESFRGIIAKRSLVLLKLIKNLNIVHGR